MAPPRISLHRNKQSGVHFYECLKTSLALRSQILLPRSPSVVFQPPQPVLRHSLVPGPSLAEAGDADWLRRQEAHPLPERRSRRQSRLGVFQRRVSFFAHFCPAAEGRGAFDIVRENVTRSVCLSLCLSVSLSLCLSIPRAPKREFGTD